MKQMIYVATTSLLLSGATALFGQATTPPADAHKTETRAQTDVKKMDADVTYGRIKEFTAGQKVVDVDNAVDKSFDLTAKDVTVKMGKGLKVGDPVKVVEHEVAGKTKSVAITKHSGGGVAHGDKDPAAKKP